MIERRPDENDVQYLARWHRHYANNDSLVRRLLLDMGNGDATPEDYDAALAEYDALVDVAAARSTHTEREEKI